MADVTAATVRDLAMARGENDGFRLKVITVAGPAVYVTAGDGLLGTGFKHIFGVVSIGDCGGYMATWVAATQKLKVYTGDYTPAADSPFVDCDAGANLSGVTFTLLVVGV